MHARLFDVPGSGAVRVAVVVVHCRATSTHRCSPDNAIPIDISVLDLA